MNISARVISFMLLFAPLAAGADAPARRPNLLFLLTDDQRADALGCAGNAVIRTPTLDALAREGTLFSNAFVTTSICCTSRASIFSGQYARRHGIDDFATPFTPEQWAQTYPAILKAAGYRTGFIGKFGVGDKGKLPEATFDYFKGFKGQGRYWRKVDGRDVHLTDVMTAQALEFVDGCRGDQPFCLSISYKAPHAQDEDPQQYLYAPRFADLYKDVTIPRPATATAADFAAQPDFLRKSESRARWRGRFASDKSFQEMVKGYYRLITHVDESVGAILAAIKKAGLDDNTVVIFMGDNGYYLGEHGLADKWFPHEESIRVPLVVRDPRVTPGARGATRGEMALNIDVAPTLLAMAGIAPPPGMQGRDLSPIVRGEKPATWRQEFFYEHRFKHPGIPMSEGVRTSRYAYWHYLNVDHDREWLFDLKNDPTETKNLIPDAGMEKVAEAMRTKTKDYARDLK